MHSVTFSSRNKRKQRNYKKLLAFNSGCLKHRARGPPFGIPSVILHHRINLKIRLQIKGSNVNDACFLFLWPMGSSL